MPKKSKISKIPFEIVEAAFNEYWAAAAAGDLTTFQMRFTNIADLKEPAFEEKLNQGAFWAGAEQPQILEWAFDHGGLRPSTNQLDQLLSVGEYIPEVLDLARRFTVLMGLDAAASGDLRYLRWLTDYHLEWLDETAVLGMLAAAKKHHRPAAQGLIETEMLPYYSTDWMGL